MRQRLFPVLAVGALLLVVLAAGVYHDFAPPEPEVRPGMTWREVEDKLGKPSAVCPSMEFETPVYYKRTDALGFNHPLWVYFDDLHGRVALTEAGDPFSDRPVWLDELLAPLGL
jgi:hypothetical protein